MGYYTYYHDDGYQNAEQYFKSIQITDTHGNRVKCAVTVSVRQLPGAVGIG